MKHIKSYQIFESQKLHSVFPKTEEDIHRLCREFTIRNYTINEDLSIDVDSSVDLSFNKLEYLPLKFNYVSGYFSCIENKLKTLKGCPKKVGRDFECSYNKLITLEGSPREVGGDFDCDNNELTTLEGSPRKVGGTFNCHSTVLFSLEGSPEKVNGGFNCSDNNLTTLEYLPNGVDYSHARTTFLFNPVYALINTFIKKDNAKELVNEFKHYRITDGEVVYIERLKMFISDFDLQTPNMVEVYGHYKIV